MKCICLCIFRFGCGRLFGEVRLFRMSFRPCLPPLPDQKDRGDHRHTSALRPLHRAVREECHNHGFWRSGNHAAFAQAAEILRLCGRRMPPAPFSPLSRLGGCPPGYRPMRACICSSLSLYMGLTPFSSFQKFGKPEKSLLRAGSPRWSAASRSSFLLTSTVYLFNCELSIDIL